MREHLLVTLVALSACQAPRVSVESATGDGGPAVDAAACAGDDEDSDGTPDDCDGCPNIADDEPGVAVGRKCHANAGFGAADKRLAFDAFSQRANAYASFVSAMGGALGPFVPLPTDEPDHLTGGNANGDLYLLRTLSSTAVETLVLTTIASRGVHVDGAGVGYGLVLHDKDPPDGRVIACYLTPKGTIAIGRFSGVCSGGCPVSADVESSVKPVFDGLKRHGLRMSAHAHDGGGTIECRVFHEDDLFTMNDSITSLSVSLEVPPDQWIAEAHVGVFAVGTVATFYSLDVLSSHFP